MSATGADSTVVYGNPPTEAPQVAMVVRITMALTSVTVNTFKETHKDILGFANIHVWVLVDCGYDSQESFLYWRFTDTKEWCQLKSNIPAIHSGVYYGYRKINCLEALAWWMADLTLWGNIIDMNRF